MGFSWLFMKFDQHHWGSKMQFWVALDGTLSVFFQKALHKAYQVTIIDNSQLLACSDSNFWV